MRLEDLIDAMDVLEVHGDRNRDVGGLAYDSRRVKPGDAFFALAGLKVDGARFVRDAVAAGAGAVVSAPGLALEAGDVTRITVAEPRLAMAQAASRFYGHPTRALRVAGVTGTNGKTTTTWMLESIFRAAGLSPGVIGTTGVRFGGATRASAFTTPEAPELQALLAQMRDAGVRAVAMEISSHALVQRRAWGVEADVVIFTNLTQDHLDYHGTMDAYRDAKLMLFDGRNGATSKPVAAVVNADDPSAAPFLAAAERAGHRALTFGTPLGREASARGLDVALERITHTGAGLDLQFRIAGHEETHLRLPMLGTFNAMNAAGACAAALALGLPFEAVRRGLEALPQVPGRLERVDAGQAFTVVVDYAHTPDALERALAAVREHAPGRVLVVFGCGGDRDRGKRPLMGAVAARGADAVYVTSDNPRSEDPAAIVAEVVAGTAGVRDLHKDVDRRTAIAAALAAARAGDVVLIAGKGHETTQTIGDRVLPFDDREVARTLLTGGRHA